MFSDVLSDVTFGGVFQLHLAEVVGVWQENHMESWRADLNLVLIKLLLLQDNRSYIFINEIEWCVTLTILV